MNAIMKPVPRVRDTRITLSHGSGGKAMSDLIEGILTPAFGTSGVMEDQARMDLSKLMANGDRMAFTTDSYVVDPLFFPGGDIGHLAVNGTVNDLAMGGAKPLYLSCGLIIEEGLPVETLQRVVSSMAEAAGKAGVQIVTGDTKVVHRGAADKLFVNTAGVGVIPVGVDISVANARPGDVVIINGRIGDHGAAILDARGELALDVPIESDCQPLNELVEKMLALCPDIHCMRDATRGGIATVLNEFADASGVSIELDEAALPIREEVHGFCEILGLDPLYLANEGKLVAIVPADKADDLLAMMRQHPAGAEAAAIGQVKEGRSGQVTLETQFGGKRMVDVLVGEQLPRIC